VNETKLELLALFLCQAIRACVDEQSKVDLRDIEPMLRELEGYLNR
jgi:hypothetical protein